MISIKIIKAFSDNYIYLLRNESKNITSVIDPGESEPVLKYLKQKDWHLNEIINTHHHNDHIGGNAKLQELFKSKLIAPSYDKNRIKNVDIFVSDNDELEIAGIKTKVIHTPGHTLGHVCLYLKDEKCLFAGDTLFYLGCGRVFEGSMEQMWSSLLKLRNLPDDTLVYCGHEYTSSNARFATYIDPKNKLLKIANEEINKIRDQKLPTVPFELGKEKYINPFLRADNNDFTSSIGLVSNIPSECFSYIRKQKDNF